MTSEVKSSTEMANDHDGADMKASAARLAIEADYLSITGLTGVATNNNPVESQGSVHLSSRQADGGEAATESY